MQNDFYTYAYLREDGTPYYIGKGRGPRALKNFGRMGCKTPEEKSRILILKQNLSEFDAYKHEVYMISVFGRKDLGTGILRNLTNGGDAPPNTKNCFWINNGLQETWHPGGQLLPPGWKKGRAPKTVQEMTARTRTQLVGLTVKGTRWYKSPDEMNNGRFVEGEQPRGWILGRIEGKRGGRRKKVR